jgi:hypothetical protein
MDFYKAIEKRHSVRSYQSYQLTEEEKKQIKAVFNDLISIHHDNLLNWKLEDQNQPSGKIFAKHDIPPEDYLIEYGFQGEQIILSLVEQGFDTLWKAAGIPSDIPAYLIFGKGKGQKNFTEKVMGLFVNAGNRKNMSTFIQVEPDSLAGSQRKIIQSCILSPSAVNKQPWSFHFLDEKTLEIRITGKSKYNYLDTGICLYHAYQAFCLEYETPELIKKEDFYWIVKA